MTVGVDREGWRGWGGKDGGGGAGMTAGVGREWWRGTTGMAAWQGDREAVVACVLDPLTPDDM